LNTLSSLEWSLQVGLTAAALLVALASARRSFHAPSRQSGELVWAVVAMAVLAAVSVAVGIGGTHG